MIISVAQTNARNYGYDFKPWTLAYEDRKIGFQEAKFKIKYTKSSPHFSSTIVERAKRERAWKLPHARKARRGAEREKWFEMKNEIKIIFVSHRRISPFSRGVISTRTCLLLPLLSLRENGDYS